jgi:hypothetical protein
MMTDMDANDTRDRGLQIDDRFLADWVEFGMAEMSAYLAKHARFADWCDRRDRNAARRR